MNEFVLISACCLSAVTVAKLISARVRIAHSEPEYTITDEDLRHEILDRERRMQTTLNSAHRNISRFVTAALHHAMQNAQTADHHKLYAAASSAYEELNPPFTLVHDFVLVEVIRYCVKHQCIPSPIPSEWGEYADKLAQIQQNISVTTTKLDVSADVSTVEPDVSGDVQTSSNVIPMGQTLPLLAAMGELKSELGNKAKPTYALYGKWCESLTNDLLKVRIGREWVKQHASDLTQKQADTLLKVFKLKAVKDGLLVPNPAYAGKPPHPEYITAQQEPATAGSTESHQTAQR